MNDLLKSINLRLNNPYILSFVISWIFWNWPIVVGLLWYNSKSLELYGYANYKVLIIENADVWKNYIFPLCFAIAYPYVRLGLSALQTTVNAIDERTTKRLSGKGYIPTQKFLDLREQYETNIQKLSDVISKESEVINESIALKTKIIELTSEVGKLKNTLITKENQIDVLSKKVSYNIDQNVNVEGADKFSGNFIIHLKNIEDFKNLEIIKKEIGVFLKKNRINSFSTFSINDKNEVQISFSSDKTFESSIRESLARLPKEHPFVEEVKILNILRVPDIK